MQAEVVKFVKRADEDSSDVKAFKTDLKLFLKYLDTVELTLSRWSMTTMGIDPTTTTFVSHYLSNIFETVKREFSNAYNQTYKALSLINYSIYQTVMDYMEWSEEYDTPIFEITLTTKNFDLSITTVMLKSDQTIITNIANNGHDLIGRLTSVIASVTNYNGELTGGRFNIPKLESSLKNCVDFGEYDYHIVHDDAEDELVPVPMEGIRTKLDLAKYLTGIVHSESYLLIPTDTDIVAMGLPDEKKKVLIPMDDLYIPGVIPLSELDRNTEIDILTSREKLSLKWNEETQHWDLKFVSQRGDYEFFKYITNLLYTQDIRGWAWETDGETFWRTLDFKFNGEEGTIRWDRLGKEMDALHECTLMYGKISSETFNFMTCIVTRSIAQHMDANMGLLSEIVGGINDWIE